MVKKIVIFAGHDDDTWEKLGAKGVKTDLEKDGVYEEYDTNILIAAGAVKILRGIPGLTVYFPQEHGRNMTLKERVDYANSVGADFIFDIHSNASASRTATGAAAFYWHNSTNGKRAANIYSDLLKAAGLPLWSGGTYASTPGTWSEFYMLKNTDMPGLLLENFFFTTRSELEKYLLNPAVQRTLMEIVANTALSYFGMKATAKPATAIPAKKDYLQYDDRGDDVTALQKYLNQVGIKTVVNGHYSAGTKGAVMLFQIERGLKADGIYGVNSKAEMNKALKEGFVVKELEVVETASPKKEEPKMSEQYEKNAQPPASLAEEFAEAQEWGITDGTYAFRPGTRAEQAVMVLRGVKAGFKKLREEEERAQKGK